MSFRTFFSGVRDWYNDLNGATLTGAIDVIVVEQEDGAFVSSPFHVRFGKLGLLKARDKMVKLYILKKIIFGNNSLDHLGHCKSK